MALGPKKSCCSRAFLMLIVRHIISLWDVSRVLIVEFNNPENFTIPDLLG